MLEDPQSSPTEHDPASPPTEMSSSARREYWRNLVTPKCQEPLEATLKPIVEIVDNSFGTPSPWADETQRAKMLSLFLRSITRETFEELDAKRDSEPSAKMFLERMDREIRDAIPLLSNGSKSGLFRCGYPLGTGEGSLTELCISDELSRRGPSGVIELFSQCLNYGRPTSPWTEELLQAANTSLRDVPPQMTDRYVAGLARISSAPREFVARIPKFFEGMAANTPLEILITTYDKAVLHPHVAVEIKTALLSETLDAIELSTGKLFTEEVTTLRNSIGLPSITMLAIPLLQRIGDAIRRGESASSRDVESLKKLLIKRSPPPSREGEHAPDSSLFSNDPSVHSHSSGADGADSASPATSPQLSKSAKNILEQLKAVSNEQLRPYLLSLLETGLEDSSSALSLEFTRRLSDTGLTKLIGIRHVLSSSDRSPEPLLKALEKRIQEEITYTVPTWNALNLAYLYELCVQCEAPPLEIKIVRQALRDALRLPEREDIADGREVSDAGRAVWHWIFRKIDPEPALLGDICRVHLPKMLTNIARKISIDAQPEPILGALLEYANELGLLRSFRPGASLNGVELWKVICLTANVSQEIGDTHGLVDTLVKSMRDRILTKPPEWRDSFPFKWSDSFPAAPLNAICSDIHASIVNMPRAPRIEALACLLQNAHLLARTGPDRLASLQEDARRALINRVQKEDPTRFRTLNNQVLKEVIEGLAAARYRSLAIQDILADECVRRADSLTPREFADIAMAFAEVRSGDSTFWSTFASHVKKHWDSYRSEYQLFSLWSLVVMAPEKVPRRFNASILHDHPPTRVLHRVTQALIALGRYTPSPDDPAYRFLATSLDAFKQHAHERKFMLELPRNIGVPAHTIFPQVIVGGFETDLIVDFGHRRLIIELDGCSHFLEGPDGGILRGKDEFQDRVFTRLGYRVFHFPTSFKDRKQHYRSLNTLVNTLKQQAQAGNVARAYYLETLTPKDRGKA